MRSFGATEKLVGYLAIVSVGLVASVALGRPVLSAVVAPFVATLLIGLALYRRAALATTPTLGPLHVVEGDTLAMHVPLAPTRARGTIRLDLGLPAELGEESLEDLDQMQAPLELERDVTVDLRARSWGVYRVGPLWVRFTDPSGLFAFEVSFDLPDAVTIHPKTETLHLMVDPRITRSLSGNRPSPTAGEGIEFADIRPALPGDSARQINWSVSSRRGEPWVTLRRPERNSDLVVFVDTFSESSYRRAIAGAVALVSAYGALRDRVGVVTFGGTLSWVSPAIGVRHLHRLVAQLLSSVPHASYVWRDLSVLPIRSLPPGCMVLALSPLDDERSRSALLDLAARGVDLAVVELASARRSPSQDPASAISLRLWGLRRWERRQQFQRLGVAVARWEQEQPLSFPIDELVMFRRRARAGR